jgi:hypothetical protein
LVKQLGHHTFVEAITFTPNERRRSPVTPNIDLSGNKTDYAHYSI